MSWVKCVTEPGSFAQHTASQMQRCRALQESKGLFRKRSSKEIGEQISNPPPQNLGGWDIYGIKKQSGNKKMR